MGDVIDGRFITRIDLPAEEVLSRAQARDLESVVILGYDKDGNEYFSSSIADGGTVLWLTERARLKLMQCIDELAE